MKMKVIYLLQKHLIKMCFQRLLPGWVKFVNTQVIYFPRLE